MVGGRRLSCLLFKVDRLEERRSHALLKRKASLRGRRGHLFH